MQQEPLIVIIDLQALIAEMLQFSKTKQEKEKVKFQWEIEFFESLRIEERFWMDQFEVYF